MSRETSAATMTGGEALVRSAQANGMRTLFGLPGAQIYPLFDAAQRLGVELLVPRHEQAAGYMAMGYAKASGRTGVLAVVPGPGVLNASAALCTAMGNCTPLVCLVGQVPSSFLGKGRGHLHELKDQQATLRTLLKDAFRADTVGSAAATVHSAFALAASGRPGPVAVEMCWDTMATTAAASIPAPLPLPPPLEPDPDAIARGAELIAAARRPLLMCGAGAQHAAEEVRALAVLLHAPVTAFRSGRGVVPEDHPLGVAAVAARELWDDVDLVIGIGSRLEMPYGRWGHMLEHRPAPDDGRALVRIDIDPEEMTRFRPHVGIVADAAVACRQLADRLAGRVAAAPERMAEIEAAKRMAAHLIARIQPQAAYLEAIREVLPRDGFFVPEVSQAGFASYTGAFPVLEPRTYVTEGFQGTLGFGFPTALGVKAAFPDRAVVSIAGDGGFLFGIQELGTAAQYGIGVVAVVFNNRSYGNVLRDQQQQFGGRIAGAMLDGPDFVRVADAFGVAAERVASPPSLRRALDKALSSGRPALIEVTIERGSEASPWPLIHMPRRPSTLSLH